MNLTFPNQLNTIRDNAFAQQAKLEAVAALFAESLTAGGVVHIYANGHSRVTVEELVVRMGALTGFHAIMNHGLTNFTDVVGRDGLRLCQAIEQVEGLGEKLLDEITVREGEPLIAVSATGQTHAAVDMALAWMKRYPNNPLICICSEAQSRESTPKHSSGKTLWHCAHEAKQGYLLDNGMPVGDLSTTVEGEQMTYKIGPLSSIGALTLVHSLNELTLQAIDAKGKRHEVLRNMHLEGYGVNYDEWLDDQRRRYAKVTYDENALKPIKD
jgi:uncharacterized phosphosugar-binding protein